MKCIHCSFALSNGSTRMKKIDNNTQSDKRSFRKVPIGVSKNPKGIYAFPVSGKIDTKTPVLRSTATHSRPDKADTPLSTGPRGAAAKSHRPQSMPTKAAARGRHVVYSIVRNCHYSTATHAGLPAACAVIYSLFKIGGSNGIL